MRGAIVVGCVLLGGGCDAILRLQRVPDPADARGDGAVAAGDASDAALPSLCATLPMFTGGTPVMPSVKMTEAAFEDPWQFAMISDSSGDIDYDDFVDMPQPAFSAASHPGLVRGGSELFYYSFTGPEVDEVAVTSPGVFSGAVHVSSLDSVLPATAVAVGGTLHMVASGPGSSALSEYTRASFGSAWQPLGAAMQAADLGVSDGSLSYPSLSADGLVLAFVTSTLPAGVYFVSRPDVMTPFAGSLSHGVLLATTSTMASPWLTADCRTLYVVDVTKQTLMRYDQ